MKNLKRVLSLALTGVMLIGTMAISAGAVNGKDFTDQDKIQHTEAVDTLVTLNVINGKDDGSHYDPEGTLTRAEMCKLIVYVLNGGKEPVLGTKSTPTYSDIKGHWAEKYIEYCSNLKIVAGQGDGTFNPGGILTASQAAKMMLTAMNYNSDIFHFTGADWEISVTSEANKAGLFDELGNLVAGEPINRDAAAQLVYNGIQAKTMERSWNQDRTDLSITETYQLVGLPLFNSKFNGTVYEGVLTGTGKLNPITGYSAGADKVAINAKVQDGEDITPAAKSFKFSEDCTGLLGEYVKVLYNTKTNQTYGVYAVEGKNTVIETTRAKVGTVAAGDTEITLNDVTYDFCAAIGATGEPDVYVTTGAMNAAAWAQADFDDAAAFLNDNRDSSWVKFVDNDGDGKLDVAFVVYNSLETVNYVGKDKMTITTLGSVKNTDMTLNDESYAEDDKVIITPKCASFDGTYGVTKAEVVEGKVDMVRSGKVNNTDNTVTSVQINDNWYSLKATAATADLGDSHASNTVIEDDAGNALVVGSTYKLYVCDGYAYAAKIVTSGGTEIALITGVTTNADFDGRIQIRLMKTDGSVEEVYAKWAGNGATPWDASLAAGQLVAYSISNGKYSLYPVGNTAGDASADLKCLAGYDVATGIGTTPSDESDIPEAKGAAFVNTSGIRTIAGKRINNDAVVFVQYDSNPGTSALDSAWKVVSGEVVNKWKTAYGANGGGLYKNSGLGWLDVAILSVASGGTALPGSSSSFGYVTSAVSKGSDYVQYSIFDGEDTYTVTEKQSTTAASKGAVVKFDQDDDSIKNVSAITAKGALTYTNGKQVKINGTAYDLADNVTILNVDSKEKAGVAGTAITKAQMTDVADVYYNNVVFQTNSDGEIDLLVVDVINNKWDGAGSYISSIPATTGADNCATKLVVTLQAPLNIKASAGTCTVAADDADLSGYFDKTGTVTITSVTYKAGTKTIEFVVSGPVNDDVITSKADGSSNKLALSDGTELSFSFKYAAAGTVWSAQ